MYNSKDKTFHCDNCGREIDTYEKCWTKWSFPPGHLKSQTLPAKVLEFENAPIICSECSKKDLRFSDF